MTRRVRITRPIPVAAKHGAVVGRVVDVAREYDRGDARTPPGQPSVYFIGDAGEEVGLLRVEFEEVDE